MKNQENNKIEMSVITETGEVETVKKLTPTKKKAILGAAAILGACTLVFGGATQLALAAETSAIENVKTTYSTTADQQKPNDLEGYVKGNYTVQSLLDDSTQPHENAMSMEEAAEIGAQNIWRFFGDNLDGKTIEMNYDSDYNSWNGWAHVGQEGTHYWFEVHALSGTLYSVAQTRSLPNSDPDKFANLSPSEAYDSNLEKHYEEYEKLARETVEKHHLLSGNIVSVNYSSQGQNNNDPTIGLDVISDIGEKAYLEYSREDKAFLKYTSNDWQLATDMLIKNEPPYDPELGAIEAANLAKLDETVVYTLEEDEKGILYVDHIDENGNTERLRIGHTGNYKGE